MKVEIHEMTYQDGYSPGFLFEGAIEWGDNEDDQCQFSVTPSDGIMFSGTKPPKEVKDES